MSEVAFIVLAHAIHVMSGVTWAGAAFVLATVITPVFLRTGEDSGPGLSAVARRAGALSGISALLTVLSGVFLFAVLHPHDSTVSGLVLKSGAMAAVLSLAVGLLVSRPAGLGIARLYAGRDGAALSPEAAQQLSRLRTRTVVSARVAALLLAVAVLAMAVFRYAAAAA
jgi:uncharacterized membrane protein